jgi:predicted transglutaminase-like cysteine proteinase
MRFTHLAMAIGSFVAGTGALKRAFERDERDRRLELSMPEHDRQRPGGLRARIRTVHTIDQRLAGVMEQMNRSVRDPYIRYTAGQLVSKRCRTPNIANGDGGWCYPERAYWQEVKAVYSFIRANVRYVRDIDGIDTFQTARRTLEMRSGDCDDYAITLGALLMAVGFPVRTKTIQTKGSRDFNHIYLQVGLPPTKPTRWKTLDASTPNPAGWEAPRSMIAKARLDYPKDRRWRRR